MVYFYLEFKLTKYIKKKKKMWFCNTVFKNIIYIQLFKNT